MAVVLSFQKGFAFTRQRIVWLCNRVSYVMIQKATGKQWRCVRGYSFSVGTAFLRVYTFLWVQQLPGYNVTVILALTSQQSLCTVQQGGSVDLASEWQLKHLCLQTGRRLTESYYRNHWTRSRFNQKNRDPPSAETKRATMYQRVMQHPCQVFLLYCMSNGVSGWIDITELYGKVWWVPPHPPCVSLCPCESI